MTEKFDKLSHTHPFITFLGFDNILQIIDKKLENSQIVKTITKVPNYTTNGLEKQTTLKAFNISLRKTVKGVNRYHYEVIFKDEIVFDLLGKNNEIEILFKKYDQNIKQKQKQ